MSELVLAGPAGRTVSVIDFMPWPGPGLEVPGGIVRLVRALSGPVDVEVEVMAGPARRPGGSRRTVGPSPDGLDVDGLTVAGPVRFEPAPLDRDTPRWRAVTRLDAGEEIVITVGMDQALSPAAAHRLLEDTETAWRSWMLAVAYTGTYTGSVARALLAVTALTGPSGGPAAAGTTSLPRRVGSERNSDTRWVHLPTTGRAVAALAAVGLVESAEAAERWLREMAETAHLPWAAWLDADGQPVPEAQERPLAGWQRSQPVLQGRSPLPSLGVTPAVVGAIGRSMSGPGGRRDDPGPLSAAFDAVADATDWACDHWGEPDAGPWEMSEPRRLHTAGRLSLLTALDRMAALARAANPLDLRAATWQAERRRLFSWLEEAATDGWLAMQPGSDEPDAALLSVAWNGPWPVHHHVVVSTVDIILERLSSGPFLYRYSDRVADEQAGPDHPDLEASFMAVRALALLGRWDEAHERMEAITTLVSTGGPGVVTETVDPVAGLLYGNFPHAPACIALVEAALALDTGPR